MSAVLAVTVLGVLAAGGSSAAQSRQTIVWLDYGTPDAPTLMRQARAQALELELDARNYVLLEGSASHPGDSPEQASLVLLARTDAAAVIWLGADPERPVSWLFVRASGRGVAKAPLPHPPDAIDPQLLAIAAASLLDQALRDPLVPAVAPSAQPLAEPPAFKRTARPVFVRPRPPPSPRLLFAQLSLLATFAIVTPDMQNTRSEPTTVNNVGLAPLGGLRVALGGWVSPDFALVTFAAWHATIVPAALGGNLAFGIDTQWWMSGGRSRGLGLFAVAGAWVGRTETPIAFLSGEPSENVVAGPLGLRLGSAARFGLSPEAALVVTPSVAMRLPTTQLELELAFAAEHAF